MLYIIALASFFANAPVIGSPTRAEGIEQQGPVVAGTIGKMCMGHTIPGKTRLSDSTVAIDTLELVSFAQTLVGTPYKYASADPERGFDCSGFVSYVFKHFDVSVPRSSSAFTKIGKQVSLEEARAGDIILFTSPKSTARKVGHVGIVTGGGASLSFIHASSGKAYSVTESTMTAHYKKRFIKVIRVLA